MRGRGIFCEEDKAGTSLSRRTDEDRLVYQCSSSDTYLFVMMRSQTQGQEMDGVQIVVARKVKKRNQRHDDTAIPSSLSLSWHWKLKNYGPVFNLPFLSKITEKIALLQQPQHLESNNLFYSLQSAYCPDHSTETTLLKIVNDLLAAHDVSHISLLSLHDLSAAFDIIDHSILLSRLRHIFGISGTALSWFQSNFSDRTQVVSVNGVSSAPAALKVGVPWGPMLGPILFVLSTHSVSEIVCYHSLSHHSFSDDNQLYKSGNISQLPKIIHLTQLGISDLKLWMTNNQLQLNNDKTEMILTASKTILNSDSVPQSINLEGCDIKLANTVCNLGVCVDPTLSRFWRAVLSIFFLNSKR